MNFLFKFLNCCSNNKNLLEYDNWEVYYSTKNQDRFEDIYFNLCGLDNF